MPSGRALCGGRRDQWITLLVPNRSQKYIGGSEVEACHSRAQRVMARTHATVLDTSHPHTAQAPVWAEWEPRGLSLENMV